MIVKNAKQVFIQIEKQGSKGFYSPYGIISITKYPKSIRIISYANDIKGIYKRIDYVKMIDLCLKGIIYIYYDNNKEEHYYVTNEHGRDRQLKRV